MEQDLPDLCYSATCEGSHDAGPGRVGVDIVKFPICKRGNRYAVVFVDYLTKWPEVFAAPDQTAQTVAELLVKEIIPHHGVPSKLLSD